MAVITAEEAKSLLSYDPQTGVFVWLRRRGQISAGRIAGTVNSRGYVIIQCGKKFYPAHRLAWLMTYDRFPAAQIDHINGDRTDNRAVNLREVPASVNALNKRMSTRNTSGFNGVHWNKREQKWRAALRVQGKHIQLGQFETIEAAIAARISANSHYGFHENHGR